MDIMQPGQPLFILTIAPLAEKYTGCAMNEYITINYFSFLAFLIATTGILIIIHVFLPIMFVNVRCKKELNRKILIAVIGSIVTIVAAVSLTFLPPASYFFNKLSLAQQISICHSDPNRNVGIYNSCQSRHLLKQLPLPKA